MKQQSIEQVIVKNYIDKIVAEIFEDKASWVKATNSKEYLVLYSKYFISFRAKAEDKDIPHAHKDIWAAEEAHKSVCEELKIRTTFDLSKEIDKHCAMAAGRKEINVMRGVRKIMKMLGF